MTQAQKLVPVHRRGPRDRLYVCLLVFVFLLAGIGSGTARADNAPIGLTVEADPSGAAITLTWTRPGSGYNGLTAYEIYRGDGSDDVALLAQVDPSQSEYVDLDVRPDTSYYYQIRALNGAGNGPWSDVRWERNPDPAKTTLLSERFDDALVDGWTLTGLWRVTDDCVAVIDPPHHLGFHRVDNDVCVFGNGTRTSGEASFPIDLTGIDQAALLFEHHRDVESLARSGVDTMEVFARHAHGETTLARWDAADPGPGGWQSEAIPLDGHEGGLLMLGFRFDTVDGVDDTGSGWNIDGVAVRGSTEPPSPPEAVTDLGAASGPEAREVSLDWSDPPSGGHPIVAYEILRGLEPEQMQVAHVVPIEDLGPGPERTFTDSGLDPGTLYWYAVRAVNEDGAGPDSEPAYAATYREAEAPAPMPYAATQTSAVYSGRYGYVFGGQDDPQNGTSTAGVVRFDPLTGESEALDVRLPSPRHATSAAWAPGIGTQGSAFVAFGTSYTNTSGLGLQSCDPGCVTSGLEVVRIDGETLETVTHVVEDAEFVSRYATSAVWVPGNIGTTGMAATSAGNGKLWIVAGTTEEGHHDEPSLSTCHPGCHVGVQLVGFDPITEEFEVIPFSDPGIEPRYGTSSVWVPPRTADDGSAVEGTGLVYIFGGHPDDTSSGLETQTCHPGCMSAVQIVTFDPVTQESSVHPTQLPSGVWFSSAAFDGTDIFLIGGQNETGATDRILRFDPVSGALDDAGTLDAPRAGTSAIFTGTEIYVFGGDDGDNATSDVSRYTPLAPQSPAAAGGPEIGEITLTWAAPENAEDSGLSGYRVYAGRPTDTLQRIADVNASTLAFTLRSDPETGAPLPDGDVWAFRVSAFSPHGEGPQSAEVSGATFDRPSAPRDLRAETDVVAGTILLEWTPPADDGGTDLTGYVLHRTTSPIPSEVFIEVGVTTSYTDTECDPSLVCTYRVAAENMVGRGDFSESVSAGLATTS